GVQSFESAELSILSRFLDLETIHAALTRIRQIGFPTLNLDLIYGIPGQTPATWRSTLLNALEYEPEELYVYPMYFRPHTGMWQKQGKEDFRPIMQREASAILAEAGYTRESMRAFRRNAPEGPRPPAYSCQEDGMIGLGCGPRSYTRTLHYSSEYAVGQSAALKIIQAYLTQSDDAFRFAHHGFRLNEEEQKRRHVIKSILKTEGLRMDRYIARFKSSVFSDLPELHTLVRKGFATVSGPIFQLTPRGIELSDALGPFLYSRDVKSKMAEKNESDHTVSRKPSSM
ncbi:MAG: coproporphyrinogen III oxidase family protein, partial [Desulfobacterales bacterium]|nr:coproporphyrinogen III oxidase family protein [Desulfobacterales bacterium]